MEDIDNPEGVPVILVNKYNKTQELKRKIVRTKGGKIPLKDLCNEWCLTGVYWHDDGVSEKLNIDKTGYSDMKFSFIHEIVLIADQITGVNQQNLANKHMNSQVTVANSGKNAAAVNAASSVKKPLDIEVTTVQDKEVHVNVQRTNALTNLVNRARTTNNSPAAAATTATATTTTTTAPAPAPVVSKPVILSKPTTTTTAPAPTASTAPATTSSNKDSSLDDLLRLAELRDKGILTEEEFTQKKRKILGL